MTGLDFFTGEPVGVVPRWHCITSFVAGDGLVLLSDDKESIHFYKTAPDFCAVGTLKTTFAAYTTPVLLDGRLYFRENDRVVCYDLRKRE
jgi:hypothetical protein